MNLITQTIPATEITLRQLKQLFGLQQSQDPTFFPEWLEADADLSQTEQDLLDRCHCDVLRDTVSIHY